MDMTVSASSEDSLAIGADIEAEGEAKLGPLPVSLRVKASVSVDKTSKRASDYTSTTHAELTMVQGPAPEGLMKIIDSLNMTTVRALELNSILIEDQAQKLQVAAANGDVPAIEAGETA